MSLLPVGSYEVTAALTGFKTDLRTVELRVGDRSRVDFALSIGGVAEQIVVAGSTPLVQAESSSTGTLVENKRIEEVPLNGRQFQNLALLGPALRTRRRDRASAFAEASISPARARR